MISHHLILPVVKKLRNFVTCHCDSAIHLDSILLTGPSIMCNIWNILWLCHCSAGLRILEILKCIFQAWKILIFIFRSGKYLKIKESPGKHLEEWNRLTKSSVCRSTHYLMLYLVQFGKLIQAFFLRNLEIQQLFNNYMYRTSKVLVSTPCVWSRNKNYSMSYRHNIICPVKNKICSENSWIRLAKNLTFCVWTLFLPIKVILHPPPSPKEKGFTFTFSILNLWMSFSWL